MDSMDWGKSAAVAINVVTDMPLGVSRSNSLPVWLQKQMNCLEQLEGKNIIFWSILLFWVTHRTYSLWCYPACSVWFVTSLASLEMADCFVLYKIKKMFLTNQCSYNSQKIFLNKWSLFLQFYVCNCVSLLVVVLTYELMWWGKVTYWKVKI